MKKVLFTSLFAAFTVIGLASCMNGDYDATPTTDNGGPNPLDKQRVSAHAANTDSLRMVQPNAPSSTLSGK